MKLLFLAVLLSGSIPVQAEIYYLAPAGNNNNSCSAAQSSSTPKASFASAWKCLSPGDTLIVRDGNYSQGMTPPAGLSGNADAVITIQAEHDGAAKVTGNTNLQGNSYLVFAGLRLEGPGGDTGVVSIGSKGAGAVSHHVTFQRIGFHCPLTGTKVNDGACLDMGDGTHDVLVEDSWVWGGGRYSVLCYGGSGGNPANTGCDGNTLRRVVIRMGPNRSSGDNPQACLALYYASNNILENVLCLDSVPSSDSSNAGFYLTQHATPPGTNSNRILGSLALNVKGTASNRGVGLYLDVDHDGDSQNTEIRDFVAWDIGEEGISLYNSNSATHCTGTVLQNVTVGMAAHSDAYWNSCQDTHVTNSIFVFSGGYGLNQYNKSGSTAEMFNIFYGNHSGSLNNVATSHDDLTVDPQLLSPVRIEPGSPGYGSGQNGSNRGADLTRRYVAGAKTETALWPWPNEARIQQEMCADSGVSTGFCAVPSLTSYVWNYLNPGKTVRAPVTLASALTDGIVGVFYLQDLAATGGTGPYQYGLTEGQLPAGLSLSTGGALTGIPQQPGTTAFTITATDLQGNSGSQAYTLAVTSLSTDDPK